MYESRKREWLEYDEWTEDDVAHLLLGREPFVPFMGNKPEGWEDALLLAYEAVSRSGLTGTVRPKGMSYFPADVVRWANKHREAWPWFPFSLEDLSLLPRLQPESQRARPVGEQNEDLILDALRKLGHDPMALPKFVPGVKGWVKAKAWALLGERVMTRNAFDDAWGRLRGERGGAIRLREKEI